MTPERLRKLRKVATHGAFGFAVFVIGFYASFPYERIKEVIVASASLRDLDVEIESAGPTFGVGLAFGNIKVATRPTEGKPTIVRIDGARVTVSPLAALLGRQSYDLSADALGGNIDIGWQASKAAGHVSIESRDIAMASLPGVKETLPLAGTLDLDVDLRIPSQKIAEASGLLGWMCRGCVVGDGKTKVKLSSDPTSEGLTVPRVRFGDFSGRIAFEKGQGKLQAVQARSPDGEVTIEGEVRLADPVPFSYVDLYVVFKLSEALLKSDDKLKLLLQYGESMGGKRPDGSYGMRLTGSLSHLGPPRWQRSSPFAGTTPAGPRPSSPSRAASAPAPGYVPPPPPPPPSAPSVDEAPPAPPTSDPVPVAPVDQPPLAQPIPQNEPGAYPGSSTVSPTHGVDAGTTAPAYPE